MIRVKTSRKSRISQGDIYKNIEYIEYVSEKSGNLEISKINFPLVIILTQDCDLVQDYTYRWSRQQTQNNDKLLLSVLVAPLYNAEHFFQGEHLSELDMQMEKISKTRSPGKYLKKNDRPRYHYLEFPKAIGIVPSVIDFKHYFSVNLNYLRNIKKSNFVCSISELYREDITSRFSNFLARIGLPEQKV